MSPEQSIAHYRIGSKLGEGGIGAVYRATDTKLNRDVAIKVLPETFAQDAARMARFEREAQVLASLNHPNIAAIFGIEQGAIVMELVEGTSLAGPLPVDTVIDYALQIATGLEAAHEKGIVHRDLKPANIKVTPEGVVKLLDFGLAKPREESTSSVSSASPTMSPTMSLAMTQAGMILGTAAYMSPEQARGKAVDRRADIWAYGIVVFELLTGRHPYGTGETVTDTLAAIVLKEPDLAALPAETPERLRRLIERCLRKDPRARLRDIGDARVLLGEPEAEAGAALAVEPAPRRRKWLPWAVAGAALAVAAGACAVAWMRPGTPDAVPGTMRFTIPIPHGTSWPLAGGAVQWVPSPDGSNLAMVLQEGAQTVLWVRPIGTAAAHRLDKTEGANYPFWSPDGQSIAFFTENSVRRISVSGGAASKICDLPTTIGRVARGDGGAWNKDGVIVFAVSGQPLMRVAAVGGIPAPVDKPEKDELGHLWPQFLPDGHHILYWARANSGPGGIYVQDLGLPKRVLVMKSASRVMWSPPGYLLFTRETTLFAQRMNLKTFQLEGEPLSVAEEVLTNQGNGRSTFAVSRNGLLVYRTATSATDHQLSWRDRTGKVLSPVGKPGHFNNVAISPDGKTAALSAGETGAGYDAWVMDLSSGVLTPMTRDGRSSVAWVMWAPDSKRLAVAQTDAGLKLVTVASGKTETLAKDAQICDDWTPDGRAILCRDDAGRRLFLVTLEDAAKPQTILTTPHRQIMYSFSPDGKFVAYQSTETGDEEIFVASFPSFAVRKRVSTNGGTYPEWAKGGKELFYRAPDGTMMNADIRLGAGIEVGERRSLFKFGIGARGNRFAVTADGQRFLINEFVSQTGPENLELTLLINWQAGMKQQ
jgi:Tol biopolymer transport system component